MFAESIPAGILQAYALALSSNRTTSAFASIFISALTTGFGSALVSYGEFWPCVASNIVYTDQTSLIPCPSMVLQNRRHGHLAQKETRDPRVLRLYSSNWKRPSFLSNDDHFDRSVPSQNRINGAPRGSQQDMGRIFYGRRLCHFHSVYNCSKRFLLLHTNRKLSWVRFCLISS